MPRWGRKEAQVGANSDFFCIGLSDFSILVFFLLGCDLLKVGGWWMGGCSVLMFWSCC